SDSGSGSPEMTFRLRDEAGHEQEVVAWPWLPEPAGRSSFGFGAKHNSARNPSWIFHDFIVAQPWEVSYEDMEAPISLGFGYWEDLEDGERLLRNQPESFS